MKKIMILAALAFAVGAYAAAPSGYYDDLEGLSGVTLKKAVKKAAKNHTAISYGSGSWSVFYYSDTRIINGKRCWWDMYSPNNVEAPNSSSHNGMNIEHGVPNSWWGKTQNDAYKDLFHLNPSDIDANSRKGNYPLGEVGSQTWSNGVTFIGHPKSGTGDDATLVYEPADEYKGDFARAYFYMFTIYDDIAWTSQWDWMYNTASDLLLKPWAYDMLLRWAKEDPVSEKEIERNEVIFQHQKNRNPFIDYPELAEHIWGSKKNTPFHLDGNIEPTPDPDPTPGPGTDPDTPDTPVQPGLWYVVTSSADLNTTDKYVLVAAESSLVMSTSTGGNSNAAYFQPCDKSPTVDKSVSPARLSAIPDDAAILTLSRDGSSWDIAVSDKNGNRKGYLQCTTAKKVTLTDNASEQGTNATITAGNDYTVISFGAGTGTLQYNPNENGRRFTTYTSSLENVVLYRLQAENAGNSNGVETGTIETADEVIYGIFTISGTKVSADNVSSLPAGIYIVVSNFGTKKIVK